MNDRQITIPLVTRTGLHVGAGYGDAVTDAFVQQDAQGRLVISGTSLAGSLRTLATRLAPCLKLDSMRPVCKALDSGDNHPCGCPVCKLFGDVNPGEPETNGSKSTKVQASAARLWIFDAYPLGDATTWVRDGVGIERAARVAHRQGRIKFDREVLPRGTKFELRLELEASGSESEREQEEKLLAAVLAEWASGRGVLGAAVSRCLGAIEIQKDLPIVYRQFDLKDPGQLMAYLQADNPWDRAVQDPGWLKRCLNGIELVPAPKNFEKEVARCWVTLTAEIRATGAFLVNSLVTSAESGFDHAPLLENGQPEKPILPGSSLKGALRSQAERIARTLATRDASSATDGEAEFLEICPVCSPVAARLEADEAQAQESCDSLLRARKVLQSIDRAEDKHLCLACRLFGSPRRGSRLRVEDAPLVGKPVYKPRDFLAIDRFTGGGADQFKFDAAVLWQPRFKVRLTLENPEKWELGWLLLALRDVQEGLVPLGFGASKGFGQVQALSWKVEFGFLRKEDAAAFSIPLEDLASKDGLYTLASMSHENSRAWKTKAWIEAFLTEVTRFQTDEGRRDATDHPTHLPVLPADTYFGTGAAKLYPVKEALHD